MQLAVKSNDRKAEIRARVVSLVLERFGRVEEELVASGILDSLRTVELALELEREFGISLDDLNAAHTVTVTALVDRLVELGAR
jgi:acyl carrier protein